MDYTPLTQLAGALNNIALVSPAQTVGYQPTNPAWPQNPPAFLFHYEGENVIELTSDITDHYIEDNTAIQDQVSLRPEKVTVHGFIGELNDVAPLNFGKLVQSVSQLTLLNDFIPGLSVTAQNAYNDAFQAYQAVGNAENAAVAAWSSVNNGENVIGASGLGSAFVPQTGQVLNNQNKQQVAFQQFYGYWRNRTFWTIQTPWAVFENMVIESLRATQDAETRVITDFHVTFKMIRIATNIEGVPPALFGRAAAQSAKLVNQGVATPASSISVTQALASVGA